MTERDLDHLWSELARLLQWAGHDGHADQDKDIWEWDTPEVKQIWTRITDPSNVELIKVKRGTAMNANWNRIFDEAWRQAVARSNHK